MEHDHKIIFAETMAQHCAEVEQKQLISFLGATLLEISLKPEQEPEKATEAISLAAAKADTSDFIDLLALHNEAFQLREKIEAGVQQTTGPIPAWLTHIHARLSLLQEDAAAQRAERRARQIAEEEAAKEPWELKPESEWTEEDIVARNRAEVRRGNEQWKRDLQLREAQAKESDRRIGRGFSPAPHEHGMTI